MQHTTWAVTVRMEKDGRFSEFDDTITVGTPDGYADALDVIAEVKDLIITETPEMKAGRVTIASARPVD